ncbi:MAG: ribonuclease E/G [Lachnospiraceae bacterium]|nr:ribonuclease E/G [Lachnospiraceae bacterium]
MLRENERKLSDYSDKNKYVFVKRDGRTYCFYMERGELAEIDVEDASGASLLHSVYVGRVQSIARNLNAAFIEYEKGKVAYLDLAGVDGSCVLNRQNAKSPAQGDELIIQIVKEPHKTKDAVASTRITLSGTYVVVSSEKTTINFSHKLDEAFCKKLMGYVKKVQKEQEMPLGAIIRTNARTLDEEHFPILADEMRSLWDTLSDILKKGRTRKACTCLYKEHSFVENKCKDIPIGQTDLVVTDDAAIYETLQKFKSLPSLFYQDSSVSLFGLLRLGKELEEACAKRVWLPCGGYLVIEVTEALSVIDVNSGKCTAKKSKDDLVTLVNGQAAEEAMRQIRLRNLSGIILIDFMKYDDPGKEQKLISDVRALAKKDKVQTDVVDLTQLGLLELTRKKISRTLYEKLRG